MSFGKRSTSNNAKIVLEYRTNRTGTQVYYILTNDRIYESPVYSTEYANNSNSTLILNIIKRYKNKIFVIFFFDQKFLYDRVNFLARFLKRTLELSIDDITKGFHFSL